MHAACLIGASGSGKSTLLRCINLLEEIDGGRILLNGEVITARGVDGGQQQRVAIVRALAMRPQLLLLDELTSALDPELVGEVLNVIRELAAGGMTMVIATHEMAFAREIADRVCFLDAGTIVEQGAPEKIFATPREPRTQQFLQRIVDAGRL